MKKIFLLVLLFVSAFCQAQKSKPVPAKKTAPKRVTTRKTTKPAIKPDTSFTIPLMVKKEDGEMYYYDLKKGDQLVYHVNAMGQEYDFIVTLNHYSYASGIDFNYEMTAPANKQGHVTISPKAKEASRKYHNYFSGGELKLTDATTVWFCDDNFGDMPKKKTRLTIDNDAPEIFYRPEKDEVMPVINVKGKEMPVEGFIVNNKADGSGDKTMWIHGISSNPLILKMYLGWTIELKEIR